MSRFLIALVVLLAAEAAVPTFAGEFHFRRARTLCRIPDHGYGFDDERITATVVSEPAVADQITLPLASSHKSTKIEDVTSLARTDGSTTTRSLETITVTRRSPVAVNRKRFVTGAVAAGPVQAVRIAALADETGRFSVSGVLLHSGGDFGELVGGRVEVIVRALSATSPDGVTGPAAVAGAVTLWEGKTSGWVTARVPKSFRITHSRSEAVARGFSAATRIEVELVYRRNR